jgi:parvulin-like peptidyl-prolyl isomerase
MKRMDVRAVWNRTTAWQRRSALIILVASIAGAIFVLRDSAGPEAATAQAPAEIGVAGATDPTPQQAPTDTAAVVNGRRIMRVELGQECLRLYGADVLDSVVNKTLIADFCARRGLVVTKQQVDEEINRMAKRFNVARDEWLKMLQQERGISPHQYAQDIIWPTVALRMAAGNTIDPTEEEIKWAYETQCGPSVQCRLIAANTKETAEELRASALAAPDKFGEIAKDHSVDVGSASAKGLIQPIRKHMGDPALEQAAFALTRGEISQIFQVGNQFVFLKCEQHLEARPVPMTEVRPILEAAIRDKKLRLNSQSVFDTIKKESQLDLVFLDPQRRVQESGVAARINGRELSTLALAEECIARHGKEVLDGMIGRLLLVDKMEKAGVTIGQADLDAEIAEAAVRVGKTTRDAAGNETPDVAGWLKEITEVQKISMEQYVHDTVWPSAALKKLVVAGVHVTEEDLKKGFEANYGPRAKCRAIVVNQMRKAQEVWQLARDNPTVDNFGLLAEQYSTDTVSRALRGEVPPIQRHGGRPLLEEEAFKLQPGELSGIIEVEDSFVILFCEGQTQPKQYTMADVGDLIRRDVYEKKLRQAMAKEYDLIQKSAQIDNFIAGTVQSPTIGKGIEPAGGKGAPAAGPVTAAGGNGAPAAGAVQAQYQQPVQPR